MPGSKWRPLHGVDQRRLHEARLQAHYAAQWLARAARAYIAPQPDDGHTSLLWDPALDGFMTQPLQDGTRLSLQISNLTFGLGGGDGKSHAQSIALDRRSDTQIRQWLGELLDSRGLDPSALDTPSPYEMPAHAIAQGTTYDAAGLADALTELAAWYANAELSLGEIRRRMAGHKLVPSPVCCWPHHFDLATLAMLPKHDAGEGGYIGVGLSPGDEYYDEPYFYVSVYPKPDPAVLPTLPMLGHWHIHEFTAAVVPAHRILASKTQMAETDEFLRDAVTLVLKILS
jgi:hypothetical protein